MLRRKHPWVEVGIVGILDDMPCAWRVRRNATTQSELKSADASVLLCTIAASGVTATLCVTFRDIVLVRRLHATSTCVSKAATRIQVSPVRVRLVAYPRERSGAVIVHARVKLGESAFRTGVTATLSTGPRESEEPRTPWAPWVQH